MSEAETKPASIRGTDRKAYARICRARISLILQHPFFATLALKLKITEDSCCHTAWTDGKVLAYNPDYINVLSSDKLAGLTAHLVMHPACGHHKRRRNRDSDNWNRACDYAINPILLDAGFTLPDGFLYREDLAGRSADTIYEVIVGESEAQQKEEEGNSESEQNSGEEELASDQDQTDGSESEDSEENDKDEESTGDPGLSGEVRDSGDEAGSGSGESGDDVNDWGETVIRAAVNARSMGKLPGGIERLLDKELRPKLSWKQLLARFIERSARSDYSWIPPNRRYLHNDIYFPGLKNSELGNVCIAVDTSGSIHQSELEMFAAEISEILCNYPAQVELVYCDMQVQGSRNYDRCELPVEIKPVGGGGTDFRPVFSHIEKSPVSPGCLIYLTDLECINYPPKAPSYPVLWVKVGDSHRTPPFGELLELGSAPVPLNNL